jgi:hypothetical protein
MQVMGNGVTLVREKGTGVEGEKEARRKFSIVGGLLSLFQ